MFIPTDDGKWVSEKYERLARMVKEYDPGLELRYIPPEYRTREDKKPYVVWYIPTDQPVLFASELDEPVEILASLYLQDGKHHNVLERMEAFNIAQKLTKQKEWEDQREELRSQSEFLIRTPLHTVRFNGKKLDHQRRPILP